ncbi:MAG: ABC transporter ATP-binding protein [Anaerovoracaceae bacterium]
MKLEIKSLSFGYDNSRKILKDISFSCSGSQIMCILGTNGTGKSTLLKCITGEERAEGTVLIDGKSLSSYNSGNLAKKIAYIPQMTVPTFPFKVLDVVLMGRTVHMGYFSVPNRNDESLAVENLEFLGIAHLKEKSFTGISGGERQLVMIAAAMTQEPELMILDEPTAHLDFGNAHRFLELMFRLKDKGVGVLMTTHFPDHALFLKCHTIMLKNGYIVNEGMATDVITDETMTQLYGLEVHRKQIGERNICIPGVLF